MPGTRRQLGASASPTPDLVDTAFKQMAFYPASYYSRQMQIQPTVTLPPGRKFASATPLTYCGGSGWGNYCRGTDF